MTLRLSLLATALLVAAAPAFASSPAPTGVTTGSSATTTTTVTTPARPAVPAASAPAVSAPARPATTTTTTTVAPVAPAAQVQRPAAGSVQAPVTTPAAPRVN